MKTFVIYYGNILISLKSIYNEYKIPINTFKTLQSSMFSLLKVFFKKLKRFENDKFWEKFVREQ
jgi:hypothetical protein